MYCTVYSSEFKCCIVNVKTMYSNIKLLHIKCYCENLNNEL